MLIWGLIIACMLGAIALIVGWRGRIVGDDPYCAQCGFNLRGRPEGSTRCTECGAETSADGAIRIGVRKRRRALLTTGGILLIVAGIPLAVRGYRAAGDLDLSPIKPIGWLVRDVESAHGVAYERGARELKRRLASESAGAADIDAIVAAALKHQADRTRTWDPAWQEIIRVAGLNSRLSDAAAETYLRQGMIASLGTKPKLRRGQQMTLRVELKFDRLLGDALGEFHFESLKLGDAVLLDYFGESPTGWRWGKAAKFETRVPLAPETTGKLANGPQPLSMNMVFQFSSYEPFTTKTRRFEIPVACAVELCADDAVIDEFKGDEADAVAMRSAIRKIFVCSADDGHLGVMLQVEDLPHPLAMRVVVKQADVTRKLGTIMLPAHSPPTWAQTWIDNAEAPTLGAVEVHLLPTQAAADEQTALGTYWGEPMIIPLFAQRISEYAPTIHEPSLRDPARRAVRVTLTQTSASPDAPLALNLYADYSPVSLAYEVLIDSGGETRRVGRWLAPAGVPFGQTIPVTGVGSYINAVTIILRPDRQWIMRTHRAEMPWGEEMSFWDVPIARPAATTQP